MPFVHLQTCINVCNDGGNLRNSLFAVDFYFWGLNTPSLSYTTKGAAAIGIAVNGIWAAGLFDTATMCRLWPLHNSLASLGRLDPIFSLKLIKPIIPIISPMAGRIKKRTLIIACLHSGLFKPGRCKLFPARRMWTSVVSVGSEWWIRHVGSCKLNPENHNKY